MSGPGLPKKRLSSDMLPGSGSPPPKKKDLACVQCSAKVLPNATNWHSKKVVGGHVVAYGELCQSCWLYWYHEQQDKYPQFAQWLTAHCSASEKEAQESARAEMPLSDLQAYDASLEIGAHERFEVQSSYLGVPLAVFESRYKCSPTDVGLKVENLPGRKKGRQFRGVLMRDPTMPGVRYLHTRSEVCGTTKFVEKSARPSVVDLAQDSTIASLSANSDIASKFREQCPSESQIVTMMHEKGISIPEHFVHLLAKGSESDGSEHGDSGEVLPSRDIANSPRDHTSTPDDSGAVEVGSVVGSVRQSGSGSRLRRVKSKSCLVSTGQNLDSGAASVCGSIVGKSSKSAPPDPGG